MQIMNDNYGELVKQDAFVQSLPVPVRSEFLSCLRIRHIPPRSMIFIEGDEPDAFYGLLAGQVGISKLTVDGRETLLTRLGPVHWFGEMSFLDGMPRTHTAYSIGSVVLASLACADVKSLLAEHHAVYSAFVARLCMHTRQLYSAVDDFILMSPERMLARRVIELAEQSDSNGFAECTQDELSMLVGISRQSVNRILRQWEDNGWISRRYRKLEIVSPSSLARILSS